MMEMEKGHTSIARGVSCPGRLREPLQPMQDVPETDCDDASWSRTEQEFNKEQMSRKTNLSRSTSLSEKELKEARVRSQIIAAQLTVPSNSSSRGVQLFNRRRQRVNAFTLESSGAGSEWDALDNVTPKPSSNKATWAERSSEEKNLNFKNSSSCFLSPGMSGSDIMEEPGKNFQKEEDSEECVIQERHFLPVKVIAEHREGEETDTEKIQCELEDIVKGETPLGSNNTDPVVIGCVEWETEMNEGCTWSVPTGKLPNGCHSSSGPESQSVSMNKQIINRTARPFFSPPTVQSPEAVSPVIDVPRAPSYATPPLPAFSASFSPLPPAPSYPTPPLPSFTNKPLHPYYSSPPPMSPTSPPSHFQQYSASPLPHYGPPTAPKPSTFVPQMMSERKTPIQIKTGILEEGAARRANRKAMFTFKEKPVVAPNPELLSMVQGVDQKRRQHKSIPEPSTEEELMALGAEASNFLAKEEVKAEEAKAPEWASSLKTSRTRPRAEHKPEQTLTNASGKGAELFSKRQSRMEKYVVENPKPGLRRSPSPTMSLPPSWVYPSNMPGRVKAIAKNSDMSAQLSQNLIAQQAAKQKPKPKVPLPQPAPQPPPPPPIENGCSKIEMDLSRHRPYQLDSSLFILKPAQDPISTFPRGAPQSKNMVHTQSLPRQTSLPSNPLSQYRNQCISPQMPMSPTGGYLPDLAAGQQRISSPAFSPERVASPRSGVQAPRPTFSAKKAGLEGQTSKEPSPCDTPKESLTPTTTPSFTRRADPSTPAHPTVTAPMSTPRTSRCQSPMTAHCVPPRPSQTPTGPSPWGSRCQSPSVPNTQCPTSPSFRPSQTSISPLSPWGSRCQSPMVGQNTQSSTTSSTFTARPSQIPIATSPLNPNPPPWATRCKSPVASQNSSYSLSVSASKPAQTSPVSPPWGSRSQSPMVNQTVSASRSSNTTATSPVSPLWGSRCQSPALSHTSLSFPTKPLYRSAASSPVPTPQDSRCMSPTVTNMDSKANHRLLAKNIINAAKRKNSVSPGALSGHNLPISPVANSHHSFDSHKPPISPFHGRSLGAQSPTFTSPPPTPTQRICSPVRLYNTRSLTDSDASVESEDSGLRSPGLYYNTLPRGWGGSLRVKRSTVSTDL